MDVKSNYHRQHQNLYENRRWNEATVRMSAKIFSTKIEQGNAAKAPAHRRQHLVPRNNKNITPWTEGKQTA